ncbi:hypothetical protein [Methanoregula sp.]|uniref:hypothetical protein n=1 Tax=Methanoregula sp. TaxID=2052170 RepID=UPI00236AFD3C|nr:hypothetical protein [Methanoregula sp.]MDD1686416.1 hypothetical protein [Methanoregula sp.]
MYFLVCSLNHCDACRAPAAVSMSVPVSRIRSLPGEVLTKRPGDPRRVGEHSPTVRTEFRKFVR